MSRFTKRNLVLALALCTLPLSVAHADGTTPPPSSPSSVTGGSPEPISPSIVEVVLSLLQLA
jgi:hypothetical protein